MATASLKYAIYFAPTLRNYKVVTHCENSHQLKVNIAIFFQTTEYNERPLEKKSRTSPIYLITMSRLKYKVCLEVTEIVCPINEHGAVI